MLFMGGVLAGTIWANLLGGDLLGQIGYFDGIYQNSKEMSDGERMELWLYVLKQRGWEAGFGGLLAMTSIAVPGYLLLSFGAGMVIGLSIAIFTLEKGGLGLGYWLASMMPHGLFYGVVWGILTVAVKESHDLKKLRIWFLIGILVIGGSLLEVWINPWIIKFM